MTIENLQNNLFEFGNRSLEVLLQAATYQQLGIVALIYAGAYILSRRIRYYIPVFRGISGTGTTQAGPLRRAAANFGNLIFPLLAILILSVAVDFVAQLLGKSWLMRTALTVAVLLLLNEVITDYVKTPVAAKLFRWIGLPILFLHMIGVLADLIAVLESMSATIGNIKISVYGLLRVAIFGSLLFWLGRLSNNTGKEIIRRQEKLDFRTRELASKLFEVGIFIVVALLLLQIMGINLTALAVFGGAVGVGLGFGLQAIASNFISGIIILLDRSVSIGDYVELADGRTGVVTELSLRSTTLETYDGKDIMVPNEKFIVESFTNWTHKNQKQRYRVDFSVAYHTDIRKLVDIIKQTVARHPQVLSGEEFPIEERPDCEIDSFGDSGVNMFVEFWMYGIDDGKNRVGGDLLLMIFEAMREHGFEIPFPQREVRVLNNSFSVSRMRPAPTETAPDEKN